MFIDWQSNKVKRIFTSLAIVAALVAVFLLRLWIIWIFDAVFLFVVAVAAWEVMRVRKSEEKGVSIFFVYSCLAVMYSMFVLGFIRQFPHWLHLILQIIVISIFALYTLIMNYADKELAKECRLKNVTVGRSSLGAMVEFIKIMLYPIAFLVLFIPLSHLAGATTTAKDFLGAEITLSASTFILFSLVLVFSVSCMTDTFAYAVGLTLKGKKLCPKISPKKTISGAVGGLFGGMLAALVTLLCFAQNKSIFQQYITARIGDTYTVQIVYLLVGLFGSILTQCGDLFASWTKRRGNVKDFGQYLPGHGGAMDRLDGIAFNVVFVLIVTFVVVFH